MNATRRFWHSFALGVLLMSGVSASSAYGQSSANYAICEDMFDNGGGVDQVGNYTFASSIGQLGSGFSASPNYTNYAGFMNSGNTGTLAAQYALTLATQGDGAGIISMNGAASDSVTTLYDTGATVTLHAAANVDSEFLGWTGGACSGTDDCVVTMNSDLVVAAAFAVKQFLINANVSEGGAIAPSEQIEIAYNQSQTFAITPNEGYRLTDVLVDGVSVGAVNEYTLANVTANHTISAVFAINTYTITANAGVGGSVQPSGAVTLKYGANQEFIITPTAGYELEQVLVDGASVQDLTTYIELTEDSTITKATLTFASVTTDHAVEARFKAIVTGGSFVRDDWRDVDKSLTDPDDDWLCWAAAAANILNWGGWNTELTVTAQDIFDTIQEYWTNAGGLMQYGWQWWLNGTVPPDVPGWAQLNQGSATTDQGGGYHASDNFFDYFSEDWATWDDGSNAWTDGSGLMATIDDYLHEEFGVTLAVYSDTGGHALTAWGYEYDGSGDYTGIYVTDSDDYLTDLKLLSVSLDAEDGLWYLDPSDLYGYSGWFIGGVQALAPHQTIPNGDIPEPGTLILFGVGLFGLFGLLKKRKKKV